MAVGGRPPGRPEVAVLLVGGCLGGYNEIEAGFVVLRGVQTLLILPIYCPKNWQIIEIDFVAFSYFNAKCLVK